jgi:hypothetical protein
MAKLNIDRTNTTETDDRKSKIVAGKTFIKKQKVELTPQIIEDDTNTGVSMDEPEEAPPPPPVGVASPTP